MLNGLVIIDKPYGLTSHQVVQKIRNVLPGVKAGHTGTLDPLATGVLPICLGRATRLSEYIIELPKTYRAAITFGKTTDTYDSEGRILDQKPVPNLNLEEITNLVNAFRGIREQLPPPYSAVKYKGKPLYRWTREGAEVPRKSRKIEIYDIIVNEFQLEREPHLVIDVRCSKGTYIRTLAADIGAVVGCGAFLSALSRLAVGPFTLKDAITYENFASAAEKGEAQLKIFPPDSALQHIPMIVLKKDQLASLKHGQPLILPSVDSRVIKTGGKLIRLYDESSNFKALGQVIEEDLQIMIKTVKYLSD